MNCPLCNYPMVNVVYGFPTMDMIEQAKNDRIVLGGTPKPGDFRPSHYCYDCQEQYPQSEIEFDRNSHIPKFFH